MYPLSDNLLANGQVKYHTPFDGSLSDGQLVINDGKKPFQMEGFFFVFNTQERRSSFLS